MRCWLVDAGSDKKAVKQCCEVCNVKGWREASNWARRDHQMGVEYSYLRKGIALVGQGTAMNERNISDSEHCFSSRCQAAVICRLIHRCEANTGKTMARIKLEWRAKQKSAERAKQAASSFACVHSTDCRSARSECPPRRRLGSIRRPQAEL